MSLRRRQDPGPDGFGALAVLWADGLNRAHDPGCGCGGLFVPSLQEDLIEADLTDYLLARYRQQGSSALAQLIELRTAAAEATPPPPFAQWIADLADAELPPGDRDRLEGDLRVFLESLNGQGRRSIGICV